MMMILILTICLLMMVLLNGNNVQFILMLWQKLKYGLVLLGELLQLNQLVVTFH